MLQRISLFALLLVFLPTAALALDYRSVGVARGIMYDAPSASGKKLFIVNQFYPVEIIVDLGAWVKVRDKAGDLAWIENKNLTTRHMLVTIERADVRETADTSGPVVFRIEKDVALERLEPAAGGWVKVRHRDGPAGYVLSSQVWGL